MRVIAITGGTGFIGKGLVSRHIKVGDEVRVLTRQLNRYSFGQSVQLFKGDLREESVDLDDFLRNVDILYHCAGEINDVEQMKKVHIDGTCHLIRAAKGRIKRWVQLSSVGAYGPRSEGTISEETNEHPKGEYEVTKTKSDKLVIKAANEYHFSYVLIRPSNVISEKMTNQSIFSLVNIIDKKMFFFIGNKSANANYVHVDNVVEALYLAGTHDNACNKTYIVSDCMPLTEFVFQIADLIGVKRPKKSLPEMLVRRVSAALSWVPGFPLNKARIDALTNCTEYSSQLISRELEYIPLVPVRQAISDIVNHLKKDT